MDLYFKKNGSGAPLIILHGLFGSSDNWFSIGKILAEKFTVFLLDARNHGRSPHNKEHSYDVMVEDLLHFVEKNIQQPVILIGHSMGGKTSMKFALKYPQWVEKMVIVDISPRSYVALQDWSHQPVDLMNIAMAMKSIDLKNVHSRNDADDQMSTWIPDRNLRAFLLKNLVRNDDNSFYWSLNLDLLYKNIPAMIGGWNDSEMQKLKNDRVDSLFFKGEKSDYIAQEDEILIKSYFHHSRMVTIPGAGHWPHAEQPMVFMRELLPFLGLSPGL